MLESDRSCEVSRPDDFLRLRELTLTSASFRLAPMSGLIRALTIVVLAIPAMFFAIAARGTETTLLAAVAGGLVLLYAAVWVWWRPDRFEVRPGSLRIVFPGRTRKIPMSDVTAFRTLTREQFRSELGRAVRIGAGGLWGGFGWLWTSHRGLIDFYISRTDGFVLVERRTGRPILLTPESPEKMVATAETAARR